MGKRTNKQIRLDTLEEVRRKDAAKHKHPSPDRPAIKNWPTKKPAPPKKRVATGLCCVVNYNGDMPAYFRPCPDCPDQRSQDD